VLHGTVVFRESFMEVCGFHGDHLSRIKCLFNLYNSEGVSTLMCLLFVTILWKISNVSLSL
jgi:hypothetical protein